MLALLKELLALGREWRATRRGDPLPCGPASAATQVLLLGLDERALRRLARILQGAGYGITCVTTLDRLVDTALEIVPDLPQAVIIDHDLEAGMHMAEVTRLLRDHPRLNLTVIFGLTRTGSTADVGEAMEAGIDAMLSKPHHPQELLCMVQRCLSVPSTTHPDPGR